MKLDLSQLFDRTAYNVKVEENLELDIPKSSEVQQDIRLKEPIQIKGNVYLTEEGVYLSTNLIYDYIENCDRCLTEFSNSINTELSAKIIEKSNQQTVEDDEIILYYDNGNLDIEDTLISTFLLSLPMKSVCKEDCKGLCDICGKNLNSEHCDCVKEEIDPRLEKLKDLFD